MRNWTCKQDRILRDAVKEVALEADVLALKPDLSWNEQRFYRKTAFAMRMLLDRLESL